MKNNKLISILIGSLLALSLAGCGGGSSGSSGGGPPPPPPPPPSKGTSTIYIDNYLTANTAFFKRFSALAKGSTSNSIIISPATQDSCFKTAYRITAGSAGSIITQPYTTSCNALISLSNNPANKFQFAVDAKGQISQTMADHIKNALWNTDLPGDTAKVTASNSGPRMTALSFNHHSIFDHYTKWDSDFGGDYSVDGKNIVTTDLTHTTSEAVGLGLLNSALVLKACANTGSLDICYIPANYASTNVMDSLEFIKKHSDSKNLMNQTCDYKSSIWTCTSGSDTNADLDIAGAEQILFNIRKSDNINFDPLDKPETLGKYLAKQGITQNTINTMLSTIKTNDFTNLGTTPKPYYVATPGDTHNAKTPMLTPDKAVLPLMQLFNRKDTSWQPYIDGDLNYISFLQKTMVPGLIKQTYPSITAQPGLIVGGQIDPNADGVWPQVCDSPTTKGCYTDNNNTKGAMFPTISTLKTIGFGPDSVKVPYYLGLYASMPAIKKADADKAKTISATITRVFAKPPKQQTLTNYIYRRVLNADGSTYNQQSPIKMNADLVNGMFTSAWAGIPDQKTSHIDYSYYMYGKNNQLTNDTELKYKSGMAIFASLLAHDEFLA